MSFTQTQMNEVSRVLGAKIVRPCPSCGLNGTRKVVNGLVLTPTFAAPSPGYLAAMLALGGKAKHTSPTEQLLSGYKPVPQLSRTETGMLPCVSTVCDNCGHTEMYSVHTLGLASILNVPPPGEAID